MRRTGCLREGLFLPLLSTSHSRSLSNFQDCQFLSQDPSGKKETTFVGFPNRICFSRACCLFFNCFELPDPYGCTHHSSYYSTHTIPTLSSSGLIPGHGESNTSILLKKKYAPLHLSNNRLARYNRLPTVSSMAY